MFMQINGKSINTMTIVYWYTKDIQNEDGSTSYSIYYRLSNGRVEEETFTSSEDRSNQVVALNDVSIGSMKIEIVESLPEQGKENTIYFVLQADATTPNVYEEYMYLNSNWELIGTTQIDLTNYPTFDQLDELFSTKTLPLITVDKAIVVAVGTPYQGFIPVPKNPGAYLLKDRDGYYSLLFSTASYQYIITGGPARSSNGGLDTNYGRIFATSTSKHQSWELIGQLASSSTVNNENAAYAYVKPINSRALVNYVGDKTTLLTETKTTLVAAINELNTQISSLSTQLGDIESILATLTTPETITTISERLEDIVTVEEGE